MKTNKDFIFLTTDEDEPILIGIYSIATIQPNDENMAGSIVTLNFARNSDLWPKTVYVKESFDQIQKLIS